VTNSTDLTPHFDKADLKSFRAKLKRWYKVSKRDLPWRKTSDAYRIWLSEIMLQQTTVAAVIPYYERFLNQFPTVHELAAAPESQVLKLWEGLGYYSRARNIHKTAKLISQKYSGDFPQQAEELQKLPGIGRYTAGAISSFAFNRPAPIVEANTQRLYARLLAYEDTLQATSAQKQLWNFAEEIVAQRDPGEFNQALMELGSQICKPIDPACGVCPVSKFCLAFEQGRQQEIPRPKMKTELTDVVHICVALKKGSKYLLQQYAEGERWVGLWDFVRWEQNDFPATLQKVRNKPDTTSSGLFKDTELYAREFARIEQLLADRYQLHAKLTDFRLSIRHGVTRYRISLMCFAGEYVKGSIKTISTSARWVSKSELAEYPLSKTGRKFAETLIASD